MNQRLTLSLMTACSLAGLVLSIYLTLYSTQTACELNGMFSCDSLLNSEYSEFMGFPVAAFGIVWFFVAATYASASFVKQILPLFIFSWSIVGLLGVFLFIYVEIFIIGALCLLCTVAHVLGVVILASSIVYWRKAASGTVS